MKNLKLVCLLFISSLFSLSIVSQDLYDINHLTILELTFEETNWDEILDNYYSAGNDEKLMGTAVINGVQFDSVGVKFKGNSSYAASNAKNPLHIYYVDNISFDNLITSIPEQTVKNNFSIYPNPASDIVTLNTDNTNNADFTLTIYNLTGELISSETLKQNQQQINVGDLSNGIYIVEIKTKEWTEKQKLTIQR